MFAFIFSWALIGGINVQKVRVLVSRDLKVICSGLALLFNNNSQFELVGREGYDVVEESALMQPDLLIYEPSKSIREMEVLTNLKSLCVWTKLIIFTTIPVGRENLKQYVAICDGYLQGPVLPGFFLKAVELVCFTGCFFYLGPSQEIKEEIISKLNIQ